ncbi:Uncharacterized protein dnl_16670 [Desulfonema limicola]|uniref:Uncharacterized protein n=1 Tax=Desulfonema limicola TaxID=45656 RepID=A0A975B608_9BACT|nr:hypothetical protein [Desulfonema limicola]QTA79397.1 Uncharacterized protein dnl_16670 [Desulfonema limicola]
MINTDTERIYKEISNLPPGEKMLILTKILSDISHLIGRKKLNNIYNIKGLGKESWKDIDEIIQRKSALKRKS